ncbi:MAG: glycosyl hydrolase [Lewinellaceae bacterium]|nr:glycosyl hydrolase [Lewinellaceae bacterium]
MRKSLIALAMIGLSCLLWSQNDLPKFTPADQRIQSFETRKTLQEQSLVSNVPFKSIGPSVFSGRVADLDVSPSDPTHFYVAYASGGLWKTENNGQSFAPLFDHEMVMTIGDIAVDWGRGVVWVGTGESNSSRSSYSGVGVYKSSDDGKTWEYKGLGESHHIGRVLMHPTDTNTVWVAALGHLYSPNEERGVYKTTDGGNTWNKVLFVDNRTGAVDMAIDPKDPNVLYAAMWHRERYAWDFVEAGEGSGIYKSTDGGENWTKISTAKSGFPTGENIGRIGLAASRQNGNTILYAIVDNQNRRPKKEAEEALTKEQIRLMGKEDFLLIDEGLLDNFLEDNDFPKKYKAEKVLQMVRDDKLLPSTLAEYLDNANTNLFDTPVIGAEVYRSVDGGMTWNRTHEEFLDNLYYSYGYYFGQIRAAPNKADKLYIYGVPVLTSNNGGRTWSSIGGDNVHVDHHALWIDPDREGHLILGNDGGINISYDDGGHWVKCNTPPVGQFYSVAVDMQATYHVYGGLQDNGVWYGPSTYEASNRWHSTGHYPYKSILSGDGMQVFVDTRDNNTVYTGFQFGFYYRVDISTGKNEEITPKHDLGGQPFRWNWQTPIHLSAHNQDIVYIGANKLFRSLNQGTDWDTLSPDLTNGPKAGDVPFGTLTAIHESPLKFGLLYTGSDDGRVHVSRDGGVNWQDISAGLPAGLWVSRIQASQYKESRVYLSLNGYRLDDFTPYVFVSENYGETWQQLGDDLPLEPVNVVKEDPVNENLLYAGSDHGLYISLDRGQHFMAMNKDLPAVPVHDLVAHPRENELLLATHGRSLYLANVAEMQQLRDSVLQKALYVFEIKKVKYKNNWGNAPNAWSKEVPMPDIALPVFVNEGGTLKITVQSEGLTVWEGQEHVDKGLNFPVYHAEVLEKSARMFEKQWRDKSKSEEKTSTFRKSKNGLYYLKTGTYTVVFEMGKTRVEKKLVIE